MCKKVFWPGIVAGVVTLILGFVVSYLFMFFPSVAGDYANTGLMRAWQDPIMWLFFLYPFVMGIVLAWVWNKTKGLFRGTTIKRGTNFGISAFLVITIPGMLISYSSFQLAFLTVLSWTVGGLISSIASGWIFAKMNK